MSGWNSIAEAQLLLLRTETLSGDSQFAVGRWNALENGWFVGFSQIYPTHWAPIPEFEIEAT